MNSGENLTPYTQFVVPLILNRFSSWKEFIREISEERGPSSPSNGRRAIRITVPSPSGLKRELVLVTRRGELTIYFDSYHTHYFGEEPWTKQHVEKALDLVDNILSDRSGVLTFYVDQKFVQAEIVELPASAEVLHQEDVCDRSTHQRANRVTVRSWSGKFDMDLNPLSAGS